MSAFASPSPPVRAPIVPAAERQLVRAIGPTGATLLVVGNVIGSAIFLTSGVMAAELQSGPALIAAWLAGGLLALTGGLTYAEMGAMFPRSGGLYVFLSQAYGPLWGFLFGWTNLLVMTTGSVAAVAVGFAEYLSYFLPALGNDRLVAAVPLPFGVLDVSAGQIVAAVSIVALGAVNYIGVSTANRVQALLTILKVAGLAAVPVLALALMPASPSLTPAVPPVASPWVAFGVAMIAVMWAYEGWAYLTMSAGEVRDPKRTLPLALVVGTLALMAIYVIVNVGYLFALDIPGMSGELRIAEKAMTAMVGPWGATFMAATVCVSTLGCNVAGTLAMSRGCFAMAEDRLFVRAAARVHPRYRTPHVAIVMTCLWSATLTLTGSYEQLFTYVTFASVLFGTLGGLAVFRLRRTHAAVERPYRVWGYPLVPIVYIAGSAALVLNTLSERPWESVSGLALVALGLPAYWYWRRPSPGGVRGAS